MTTFSEQLKELSTDIRQMLNEEFEEGEWLLTNPETYQFFRALATAQTPNSAAPDIRPKKKISSLTSPPKPKPPAKPEKPEEPPEPKEPPKKIDLQKPKPAGRLDLSPQIEAIQKTCPQIKIISEIPEPKKGYVILFMHKSESPFWDKVLQALNDRGVETKKRECGSKEELILAAAEISDARLVILPRQILGGLSEHGYHSGGSGEHFLKNVPLIPVEEAALYESDVYLKRMLWQNLRSQLKI